MTQATIDWTLGEAVLADLSPVVTRACGAEGALIGGFLRGAAQLQDRQAVIYRCTAAGETHRAYEGPGWIAALDRCGGRAYAVAAVLSLEGSGADYRLLQSGDDGRTWAEVGPVPARSVTQLLVAGESELWVLGASTLLRSADRGGTWASARAPGDRDPTRERLAFESGATLLLGDGVHATTDGGATWRHFDYEGWRIGAVSGPMAAAWSPSGETRLGMREPEGVAWYAVIEKPMRPFRLVLDGDRAAFLALPTGQDLGRGLYLYETADGGATWQAAQIHCPPSEGAADLAPGGVGVAVDAKGRLLTRGWA